MSGAAQALPVRKSPILGVIFGAHFDHRDFAWYAVGLGIAGAVGTYIQRAE